MIETTASAQTTSNPTVESGSQNPAPTGLPSGAGPTGLSSLLDTQTEQTQGADQTEQGAEQTQEQTDPNAPKLWANKYKSPEEMEKGVIESQKMISKQAEEIKALKAASTAPEAYEWDPILKETEGTLSDERRDLVAQAFKEVNMNQTQANAMVKLYKNLEQQAQAAAAAQYGPPVDQQREMSALQKAWGSDFDTKVAAVREFVTTLPRSVVTNRPFDTAEGWQWAYGLVEKTRGPAPVTQNEAASGGTSALEARMYELQSKKEYWMSTPEGEKIREEALRISKMLNA